MNEYLCHDFKTPRNDTSRRLPSSFRAIPVIFYVALIGSAYVMTMDYFNYKRALKQKVGSSRVLVDWIGFEVKPTAVKEDACAIVGE